MEFARFFFANFRKESSVNHKIMGCLRRELFTVYRISRKISSKIRSAPKNYVRQSYYSKEFVPSIKIVNFMGKIAKHEITILLICITEKSGHRPTMTKRKMYLQDFVFKIDNIV